MPQDQEKETKTGAEAPVLCLKNLIKISITRAEGLKSADNYGKLVKIM